MFLAKIQCYLPSFLSSPFKIQAENFYERLMKEKSKRKSKVYFFYVGFSSYRYLLIQSSSFSSISFSTFFENDLSKFLLLIKLSYATCSFFFFFFSQSFLGWSLRRRTRPLLDTRLKRVSHLSGILRRKYFYCLNDFMIWKMITVYKQIILNVFPLMFYWMLLNVFKRKQYPVHSFLIFENFLKVCWLG